MVKFKRNATRIGLEDYPCWCEGYEFESHLAGNGNDELTAEVYKTTDGTFKTRWHLTESLTKIQD